MNTQNNSPKTLALALGILALIVFAFGFFGNGIGITGHATASELREHVRVADIAIAESAPLYYALDNGLFDKEGVDVEVVRFQAPKDIVDAVASNKVDLSSPGGATGIAAIAESLDPGKVKYYSIACHYNDMEAPIIVRPDSNISTVKDLAGKTIAKLPGPQWTTITRQILKANNVDPKNVTLLDLAVPEQLPALSSGRVDAVVALNPVSQIGVAKGIAKVAISGAPEKYVVNPICNGAGLISKEFTKNRPQVAVKVLHAMITALKQFNEKPRTELLVSHLKIDNATAALMPYPFAEFTTYDSITPEQKQATQKFLDVFYEDGVIKKRVMVEDILLSPN